MGYFHECMGHYACGLGMGQSAKAWVIVAKAWAIVGKTWVIVDKAWVIVVNSWAIVAKK